MITVSLPLDPSALAPADAAVQLNRGLPAWRQNPLPGEGGGAGLDWRSVWRDSLDRERRRPPEGGQGQAQLTVAPPLMAHSATAPSSPSGLQAQQPSARLAAADARSGAQERSMRVHAEWSALGVRVWIGAPVAEQAGLGLLGAPLRAVFDRQGVRLVSLVCNGSTVYCSQEAPGSSTAALAFTDEDAGSERIPPQFTTPTGAI